jgi:hypothetical protein
MKKFFILVVFHVLVVGLVYSVPSDEQIRQAANTLGVPFADLKQFVQSYQAQTTPSGTLAVSASELIQAYSGNQLQANNKYKGKRLQVTGYVKRIGSSDDKYFVELMGSEYAYSTVLVYVLDSELPKIANLEPGQTATFIGSCSTGDSYSVEIIEATLVR